MFTHPAYENSTYENPTYENPTYENDFASPNLTELFHRYVEESISDEQVQRILKPIFEKIDAGEFSKGYNPRRLGGTPFVSEGGSELVRQSYKFQLVSSLRKGSKAHKGSKKHEASLDIIWKGAELHIRIEYK